MDTTLFATWALLAGLLSQQPASTAAPASVSYDYFKTKVQPIFLAKRPGRARCVVCHSRAGNNSAFRLQPLAAGSTNWTEEETRKNFESSKILVVPGSPERSRLLTHPLAEEAGGDFFHTGGKQFESQNSAEWQALRAWVLGRQ
jgi:hypothetical protein